MPLEFTDEQKRIFEFVEKESSHGIIDAVAGAGKTTTIMECARFVKNQRDVLFCAFNNSIANEIGAKFKEKGMYGVVVKTIHSLGRQILHENNSSNKPITLQEKKFEELLKNDDVAEKLKPSFESIIKINNLDEANLQEDRQRFALNNLVRTIHDKLLEMNHKYRATLCKDNIDDFEQMLLHFGIFSDGETKKKNFKKELESYFEAHKILLNEGNELSQKTMIIDYTDMLYLPYLWKLQPINKFSFIFIDECQDLSKSQFAIASKYGRKGARILAVGDPRQSIYGFTGADINSFSEIKTRTSATELPLTSCFRCPQGVIELAKAIRPDIVGTREDVGLIEKIEFKEIISKAQGGDLIISRLRLPILMLVFEFIDKNIKVRIHEDEVKEIISEIKSIFKPNELNVMIPSLYGEFESVKDDVLQRWSWIIDKNAKRIVDTTERSLYVTRENNYLEHKLNFLHKKYEQWKSECSTILEIISKIKEFISATVNPIKLSTIHRAKGLEENRVFILDYDELPYTRLSQKDWEQVQELNLKYVAVTRAKQELFLVKPETIELDSSDDSLFDDFFLD